ncbi:uncharacterized protein L201_008021 [Kwoniella dendrophila CBS 6074]|uniref:Uncharacterized protein n=1 Tax=Kwoniella dendrophila CBS 6074 TaxID=1295534 RepID=A0AAX4K881_9TREE
MYISIPHTESYPRSLEPRLTWGSSGASGSSSSFNPAKVFIPVFAVFFAIVAITILITCIRRADIHRRLHTSAPPPRIDMIQRSNPITHNYNQYQPRSSSPFTIDSPTVTVTPFPAPTTTTTTTTSNLPTMNYNTNNNATSNDQSVIQTIPTAYQSTPTARSTINDLPNYTRSYNGMNMNMPPTYEEASRIPRR